jgi:carbamoyl-phosphate synthase large subunit
VDIESMGPDWKPLFTNANDGTNEGSVHVSKPFYTVQFHPEATAGPHDSKFLFDRFLNHVRKYRNAQVLDTVPLGSRLASGDQLGSINAAVQAVSNVHFSPAVERPTFQKPKKVLILGSGGLSIGQAGEFDYSGCQGTVLYCYLVFSFNFMSLSRFFCGVPLPPSSSLPNLPTISFHPIHVSGFIYTYIFLSCCAAIKALQSQGIKSVLINPNIASVQTAEGLADEVYLLPVTKEFVTEIIKKERPDAVFLQFGGQTALNVGIELDRSGVLREYGVRVLGTTIDTVIATEDRGIFAEKLLEIGEKIAKSTACTTVEECVEHGERLGYPVIARAAFSLGGLGSGFVHNSDEMRRMAAVAFATSPQLLIEKSLKGWKEVEYEVVRDEFDNCVTVCNMENFDPMGTHTGDSIVIAPSQTLCDKDYHMLRSSAMRVARHLGIVGECNVQFGLDTKTREYVVIEVNPRLSRSSALASKATGYPLAWVAGNLALGKQLADVTNSVTGTTTACFEPSLDYLVCKVPRWDMKKFRNCDTVLGSGMKSVGEVMGIGRTFEEAFQKGIRMVDSSNQGFEPVEQDDLEYRLRVNTQERPFAIAEAMRQGWSAEKIAVVSQIDVWWLKKLEHIKIIQDELSKFTLDTIPRELMKEAKEAGLSDKQIAKRCNSKEDQVRLVRKAMGVIPCVKQIDTLAAEFPAMTNYLYTTYGGTEDDVEFTPGSADMVLGSGVYRIGSSVEFDYSAVQCIRRLRELGKKTIMVNYNPETVSTDFDESDRLYFEELSLERVLDIIDKEQPEGIVVSVGGQIPNTLALDLHKNGAPIMGTSAINIDNAEDRAKYSDLMDSIGVDQPSWQHLKSYEEAEKFSATVGYPVLVRPSYVLSGAAMKVVRSQKDLRGFLANAVAVSDEHPVVISKFIENSLEIECDAVAQRGEIKMYAIAEHIEQAGVHSGDASLVFPTKKLKPSIKERILEISNKIAKVLDISGPMNSQFIVNPADDSIKVIETNVRASRSVPFVSKVLGINFIAHATDIFNGIEVPVIDCDDTKLPYVGVKVPQFSYARLRGADPVLGVEMASTGEVACFGNNEHEAFLKSMLGSTFRLPKKNIFLMGGSHKEEILASMKSLAVNNYEIFADKDTAQFLQSNGVGANIVKNPEETLKSRNMDLALILNDHDADQDQLYQIRCAAVNFNTPIITNLQVGQMLAKSLDKATKLHVESYQELRARAKN